MSSKGKGDPYQCNLAAMGQDELPKRVSDGFSGSQMGQQLTEKQMTNGGRGLDRWITVWIIGKHVFFHLTSLEDFS